MPDVTATAPLADSLRRFVFEHAAVRGAVVSLDASCREILDGHPYPPALRRVLAELLAAAALLASTLKFKGSLIVQLQGEGPVRLLVVECDADQNLRATAQWSAEADALPADTPLAALAGDPAKSRLAIMLDPKDSGPIYQGIVALEPASVATMIEHYLTASEQIDSRLALAAGGDGVRGLLVQRLPGASAEDDATWQRTAAVVEGLDPALLHAADAADALLATHFPEDDLRLFAPRPARFHCSCSADRVTRALRMLGRTEVESILAEQGLIGVTCEFCNRQYTIVAEDARALFATADAAPADAPRH
jgi:molecular chaperone Hsp33